MKKINWILLPIAMITLSGCTSYGPWLKVENPEEYNLSVYRRSQMPQVCIFPVVADVPDQIGVKSGNRKIVPVTSWRDK